MKSIQVLGDGGELVNVTLKPQTKLFKADRMIDHQCISKLASLKPAELKLLMVMWEHCDMNNFIVSTIGKGLVADRHRVNAINSLINMDLIKKAKILTGKQKWKDGYMINPFYFRKAKSYDDYNEMTDNYNFGGEAQIVMSLRKMVKQQEEVCRK